MRITTGIAKNRRVKVPKLESVKPTKEVVRDAIFNIVGSQIREFRVADLFAGSGSLGLEALSRGAKHVDFVDQSNVCTRNIQENLNSLGFSDQAEVFDMDVEDYTDVVRKNAYHLIIADPPYDYTNWISILALAKKVLVDTGLLIIEHKNNAEIPAFPGLELVKTKKYGVTRVTILQNQV